MPTTFNPLLVGVDGVSGSTGLHRVLGFSGTKHEVSGNALDSDSLLVSCIPDELAELVEVSPDVRVVATVSS